ncbi:MAG: flagellin [Rickettsiales bacterium]
MPVSISSSDSKIAQANINRASSAVSESVSNLVTGKRQNANVADFSVGTVLSTKVEVLKTATLNAGQAKSLLSTAKGGLETIADLLTSQKNLATKASDDSLSDNERGFLNQEFQALSKEIDRIANNTNFNGKALINGSISGKASGSTKTAETSENYSLTSTNQFRLAGTVSSGNLVSSLAADTSSTEAQADGNVIGAFGAVASENIGTTRAQFSIDVVGNAAAGSATQAASITVAGGSAIAFTYSAAGNAAADGVAFVNAAATALNQSTDANARKFTYEAVGSSLVVTAKDAGDAANTISFQVTGIEAGATATVGNTTPTDIAGSSRTIAAVSAESGVTQGANRGNASNSTFDAKLEGQIKNISATVTQEGAEKRVTFSAEVNGQTYTSNSVGLQDTGTNTVIRGSQALTFFNANGAKDSSGNLTDNGFQLTFGSSDVSLGGSGASLTTIQNALNSTSTALGEQLSKASIVQERAINADHVSATDDSLKAAVGTVLEGLTGYSTSASGGVTGALRVRSDNFGSDGSFGSIGSFSYDKDTFKLSTTVNGVTYTADLSDSTSAGTASLNSDLGLSVVGANGSSFSTSNKNITINSADRVQIVLNSSTEGDGKQIILELAGAGGANGVNTTSIDLSTDTAASNFATTLNNLFGVASNNSLSFQVGSASSDAIGVSIGGATTSDLYKDSGSVTQSLNIGTLDGAKKAGDVLNNAINKVISLISDVDAATSSFDSAIANNESSIQNADAARSSLLDTDYSKESTEFTEATVKADAASAILAQVNSRIGKLLQLLRF